VTANQEVHPYEYYTTAAPGRRYRIDERDDKLTAEM
jgi:hypothetical protein